MLHCSALPYLPITNLYKFLFSMKHIGLMHPAVNAINYISGFMINVSKKKSFEFFNKHFSYYYLLSFDKAI